MLRPARGDDPAPQALVGAGTVLEVAQVQAVADAGGRLIASPNANANANAGVIRAAVARGLIVLPGVAAATMPA